MTRIPHDLIEGDIVEVRSRDWAPGTVLRGPVCRRGGAGRLYVGDQRLSDFGFPVDIDVTVIEKRVYVNAPRKEPALGDVVRDAEGDSRPDTWAYVGTSRTGPPWRQLNSASQFSLRKRDELPKRLKLLVNGETGQAVP